MYIQHELNRIIKNSHTYNKNRVSSIKYESVLDQFDKDRHNMNSVLNSSDILSMYRDLMSEP